MAIPLSPELQHALQGSQAELEVVDPSTNRSYVIVAKDQWLERTSGGRNTGDQASPRGSESGAAESWTEEKNRRRADLVDREIAGTLTDAERGELCALQQQMRAYREKVAPLPLEDTRRLHAELMEQARRAQTGNE